MAKQKYQVHAESDNTLLIYHKDDWNCILTFSIRDQRERGKTEKLINDSLRLMKVDILVIELQSP